VQKLVMCYGPYAGFGMRQWPQRRSKTENEKYAINFPLWAAVWDLVGAMGQRTEALTIVQNDTNFL
jgi:hypothetical protein